MGNGALGKRGVWEVWEDVEEIFPPTLPTLPHLSISPFPLTPFPFPIPCLPHAQCSIPQYVPDTHFLGILLKSLSPVAN